MAYTYIKNNVRDTYVTVDAPIDEEYWRGLIGSTLQDFLDGKWVLLSEAQAAFRADNPGANVVEVWNMELTPAPERTLQDARSEKLAEIDAYDNSENVNSFVLGGATMWLDFSERERIRASIAAYSQHGATTMTKWFKGQEYTFPLDAWARMLNALEVYASEALNVTEMHKAAVQALGSIEEVDGYDHTAGYPELLTFSIGEQS